MILFLVLKQVLVQRDLIHNFQPNRYILYLNPLRSALFYQCMLQIPLDSLIGYPKSDGSCASCCYCRTFSPNDSFFQLLALFLNLYAMLFSLILHFEALPVGIYLIKVKSRNTKTICKICSKSTS